MIRYDPRDLAEIRVFHENVFLCRAICPELAGQTVTLQEIVQARNRRRRQLRKEIKTREELLQTYLQVHQEELQPPSPSPAQTEMKALPHAEASRRLKLYENE